MAKTKKQLKKVLMDEKHYGNTINGVIYYMDKFDVGFLQGLLMMKSVVESRSKQ